MPSTLDAIQKKVLWLSALLAILVLFFSKILFIFSTPSRASFIVPVVIYNFTGGFPASSQNV